MCGCYVPLSEAPLAVCNLQAHLTRPFAFSPFCLFKYLVAQWFCCFLLGFFWFFFPALIERADCNVSWQGSRWELDLSPTAPALVFVLVGRYCSPLELCSYCS